MTAVSEAIRYVSDEDGHTTAVLVPIELWREIFSETTKRRLHESRGEERVARHPGERARDQWKLFVAETYGSMADAPIERGDQGSYEKREDVA